VFHDVLVQQRTQIFRRRCFAEVLASFGGLRDIHGGPEYFQLF
jgi:hypothetical protein